MKNYKIITNCTAITEYQVKANNEQEARSKFFDGEYTSEKITDYINEEVESIEVAK